MANRENISVSFTPHQAEFLADCVASGRYQSMSEDAWTPAQAHRGT